VTERTCSARTHKGLTCTNKATKEILHDGEWKPVCTNHHRIFFSWLHPARIARKRWGWE
jgi:hypothetical protein